MPRPVNQNALRLVDRALQLVDRAWPARCVACGEPGHAHRDLCRACLVALPRNRHACLRCAIPLPGRPGHSPATCGPCLRQPPLSGRVHAPFLYATPLDRLLPRLKFHGDLAAGRVLSRLLAEAFADLPQPQALVLLPLHPARLRARGYDQALELARPLARALALPLYVDALQRVRATAPQSRLDASQRRGNVRGAFAPGPALPRLPAHVALVDDVMTTGATLQAAARVLHRGGVACVDAWVCARVR